MKKQNKKYLYAFFTLIFLLILLRLITRSVEFSLSPGLHTSLSGTNLILLIIIGSIMVVRFKRTQNLSLFFIINGFISLGIWGIFYAFITSRNYISLVPTPMNFFIPWCWWVGRILLSLNILLSWWFNISTRQISKAKPISIITTISITTVYIFTTASLLLIKSFPSPYSKGMFFPQPIALFPGMIFFFMIIGFVKQGFLKPESSNFWFIFALSIYFFIDFFFIAFSKEIFDPLFTFGHLLNIFASLIILGMIYRSIFDLTKEIERSEKRNRSILDTAPITIVIKDLDQKFIFVNKKFEQETGLKYDEVIGKTDYDFLPKKEADFHAELDQQALENLKSIQLERELLINNENRYRLIIKSPLFKDNDFPEGVCSWSVDIDSKKRLEIELKKAINAAEEANKIKNEFLSNISHEIRTPMNAVLGLTHLLLQENVDKKQAKTLNKLHNSAFSLMAIINSLLDFSRIQSSELEISQVPFYINDLFLILNQIYHTEAKKKNLELNFSIYGRSDTLVLGDVGKLLQVLRELLGNAIKFTKKGSISVNAEIEQETNSNIIVKFFIKDTGIGISKQQIKRILNQATQADGSSTRDYSGLGLNLYLAKNILSLMGGELHIESEPGKGSTFTFSIEFEKSEPKTSDIDHDYFVGTQILLVEDNQINQLVAEQLLSKLKFKVSIANNGEEAVAMAKSNAYNAILMDIQMPVMCGLEATSKIRKLKHHDKTPIIALTAHTQKEDTDKIKAAGMQAHLTKPIDSANLYSTLKSWITPTGKEEPVSMSVEKTNQEEIISDFQVQGVNVQTGLKRIDGDIKLYKLLLFKFHSNQMDFADNFEKAMKKGDTETTLHLAHTLKGVAGNIGAEDLYEGTKLLEAALKKGQDTEVVKKLFTSLKKSLEVVFSSISKLKGHNARVNEDKSKTKQHKDLKPSDQKKIKPLLIELYRLLSEGSIESSKVFEKIYSICTKYSNYPELDLIKNNIEAYNFEFANEDLSKFADKLVIDLKNVNEEI